MFDLQIAVDAGPGRMVCKGQQVLLPKVQWCGALKLSKVNAHKVVNFGRGSVRKRYVAVDQHSSGSQQSIYCGMHTIRKHVI